MKPHLAFLFLLCPALAIAAHQATGIKIVEPTDTAAVVWTRITRDAQRAPDDGPLPILRVVHRQTGAVQPIRDNAAYPQGRPEVSFPPGAGLDSIRGAAIGAPGQTRVRHRAAGARDWITSPWRDVDPTRDFTAVFALSGLAAGTRHDVEVEARPAAEAAITSTVPGSFTTAPAPRSSARVAFTVMSCQKYEMRDRADGFAIYPAMLARRPDFMVNTGDVLYYDHGPVHALNHDLARYHWARMFSFPTLRNFHRMVGSYFMKDDHDVLYNDCEPGERTGDFTFADGLRVFAEQTAQPPPSYRTIRWGRDLQIWLVEGRDFRTARSQEGKNAPTIWGAEQITWLLRTLAESDATFRVLITSTPIVGPDRAQKDDNYSNPGFATEGGRIREMLGAHRNLTVITGDRHWQYVSTDPATGLEEWSVGAATDKHAGGWNEETPRPMHRFLRIKHGGFLSGEVTPGATSSAATLTLRLHDTAGKVIFESTRP
ncbi:MAG: alkaline phosphatase D family protein [Opitutaceae bacterium]|nr:alkaline phosphatase D family protein [Opitutaceae bacterium]